MEFAETQYYDVTFNPVTSSRARADNNERKIMVAPEDIKSWIEQNLPDSEVEISGDGRHFDAVIVSAEFVGKTRIQQHQMVYAALGDKMRDDIHALSMRTMTPEEQVVETVAHH